MNLLIVMTSMGSGGAEKSLVSMLNALADRKDINIDLLIFNPRGLFMNQIPSSCNILYKPKEIFCMSVSPSDSLFRKNITIMGLAGKLFHGIRKKIGKTKELDDIQFMWQNWNKFVPQIKKHYDVAISYMHGVTNYFLIDKCNATKKFLYIHHEYAELPANHEYDRDYFSKATGVLTVSPKCVESILEIHPGLKGKVHSIENILSSKYIRKLANEYVPQEYDCGHGKTIVLSIGRLIEVKRFDRVIEASEILKKRGIKFVWFIIGCGQLREKLESIIVEKDLIGTVIFLGERENPYPYIKHCDIFVQTSDNEGKSIVIDEAKILTKPIVVTNYTTVKDVITNNDNGLVVERNSESIANGIEQLIMDNNLKKRFISMLESQDFSNEFELNKLLDLFQLE